MNRYQQNHHTSANGANSVNYYGGPSGDEGSDIEEGEFVDTGGADNMEEGQGTAETDDDAITSVMPPQINVPSKFLDSAFNAKKTTKSCREKSKQQTSDMQCNNSRQSSTSICRDTSQKSTSANSLNSSQQETSSACLDTCKNSGSETNCLNTSQQSTSSANCQLNASVTSQASESSLASEYRRVLIIHCMGVYLHTVRQDIFKSGEGALSDILVSMPTPLS